MSWLEETNYVSYPGDTLRELLQEKGMSQKELAVAMACTEKDIDDLIHGPLRFSAEQAEALEEILHVSADFWIERDRQYDAWCRAHDSDPDKKRDQHRGLCDLTRMSQEMGLYDKELPEWGARRRAEEALRSLPDFPGSVLAARFSGPQRADEAEIVHDDFAVPPSYPIPVMLAGLKELDIEIDPELIVRFESEKQVLYGVFDPVPGEGLIFADAFVTLVNAERLAKLNPGMVIKKFIECDHQDQSM